MQALSTRERVKLGRTAGADTAAQSESSRSIWYDATATQGPAPALVRQLPQFGYNGVLLRSDQVDGWLPDDLTGLKVVVTVDKAADLSLPTTSGIILASSDAKLLDQARAAGHVTCWRAYVDSSETLHAAIAGGKRHRYLSIRFRDPTNIPLELVIASLQASGTVLINEIEGDVEAAMVVLGVMEVGADGIMFSPRQPEVAARFGASLAALHTLPLALEPATIVQSRPVGMGLRACVDLATMFSPEEGMLVGSTSQGGILLCPEVFHLPYMELRPFRVNAGAVHSYVYGVEDTTNYISELRAGASALIVNHDGTSRRAVVGRIKTEMRPLRLLEAQFASGESVNVILQDDWHVRVYSADGKPLNITEIKPGDKVLAHKSRPGRHVGISVEEQIVEV